MNNAPCSCLLCKDVFPNNTISSHYNRCKVHKRKLCNLPAPKDFICDFCKRECKSIQSYRNHERLCKYNPNRQSTPFQDKQKRIEIRNSRIENGTHNQYTKAKALGLPKPQVSDEIKQLISEKNKLRSTQWNKENGRKISETVKRKVEAGEWHTSLAKRIHYSYNGVDLHGSWEYEYAKWLDTNGIEWVRCKDSFPYIYEGKIRRYTPDFYLVSFDKYVEIKGYKTDKDDAKWNQFPKDKELLVLRENDLKTIGII